MSIYEMKVVHGHVLMSIEGKSFIIDTGAGERSVSREDRTLNLSGRNYPLAQNRTLLGQVNELLLHNEHQADGILGLDVLRGKTWEFDFQANQILVDEAPKHNYDNSLPVEMGMTTFLNIQVNGTPCRAILDTGAWVSYATQRLTANIPSCGDFHDFSPNFGGEINTTKHAMNIQLGNRSFGDEAAKAPFVLNGALENICRVSYLIGITYWKFASCRLDLINNQFEF